MMLADAIWWILIWIFFIAILLLTGMVFYATWEKWRGKW